MADREITGMEAAQALESGVRDLKQKREVDELLNTLYQCKKCGATFPAAQIEDALKCARQLVEPKYKLGIKVMWNGNVIRITERRIIPLSHELTYRFRMKKEDNPPETILSAVLGWTNEVCFSEYTEVTDD